MEFFQDRFIQNEIWTLTFSAAFQRANIYNDDATVILKRIFKIKLKKYIEEKVLIFYARDNNISDVRHIQNILAISHFTNQFSTILNNGSLNFGVCQKLLNLLLKYQWCIFKYPEPPHFPVDRRIQEIFRLFPIEPWTRITTPEQYLQIIERVRAISNGTSIAQFELEHYERRRNQIN